MFCERSRRRRPHPAAALTAAVAGSHMPPHKPRIFLALGKTSEEVCRLCLPALGCREVGGSEPCDLRWIVGEKDLETALQAEDRALVNKFPGMRELCHKAPFARLLARMAQLYPADYRFFPRTWVLPSDDVPSEGRRRLIVKPDDGSQGDGIFVASGWDDVRCKMAAHGSGAREFTVQEYITKPLLLGGLKFDLRVYVIVTSLLPLRVHLCREGIARFATTPYEAAGRDLTAHLTNYSLNVRTSAFAHNDDPLDGARGSSHDARHCPWLVP